MTAHTNESLMTLLLNSPVASLLLVPHLWAAIREIVVRSHQGAGAPMHLCSALSVSVCQCCG